MKEFWNLESKPTLTREPWAHKSRGGPKLKDELQGLDISTLPPAATHFSNEPHSTNTTKGHSIVETSYTSLNSTDPPKIFTPSADLAGTSSNETSFQSVITQIGSQEYPCTQETTQVFHSFCGPANSNALPPSSNNPTSLAELISTGPFSQSQHGFPNSLPFRNRYELLRVSQASGIDISALLTQIGVYGDDYQTMWRALSVIANRCRAVLPEKGSLEAWNSAKDCHKDNLKKVCVIFSGKLEWSEKGTSGLFHLRLNPMNLEEGCRFYRTFGSDRFLAITIPSLSQSQLPDHLRKEHEKIRKVVSIWLATSVHHLGGRNWRAFYVEPIKRKIRKRERSEDSLERKKTKPRKSDEVQSFKVHFFAVDGNGFLDRDVAGLNVHPPALEPRTAIAIEDFINWHIPIQANIESTDCKAFQRFALGLSRTLPSAVLESMEFAYSEDVRRSPSEKVMNDGCARMSMTLANSIAGTLGLKDLPSVFQGRIAGAKGLWIVEKDDVLQKRYPSQMSKRKFCIEVTPSQLKIQPHPKDNDAAHGSQRTFEVVDWSVPPRPASLNLQLMSILHEGGVSREVLKTLLLADNNTYHDVLFGAMADPLRLREWIGENKISLRGQAKIPYTGAWPDEIDEQVIMLLESGFTPDQCPILLDRCKTFLKRNLDRYVEKMQVRIPFSTYLYCIADPYGILEPDEVHVGFSKLWRDPSTPSSYNVLYGLDVLVGRLPALLPSDIQRRKAVWKEELGHFKDVIIFSSKGEVPLADMLSGGDYDGDTPWLCFDQRIVQEFQNVDVPRNLPTKEECGLVKASRKLSTIFTSNTASPSLRESEEFLIGCFEFNLHPSFLGLCTLEHEKVSYYNASLSCPEAIKLATLASYLVDSGKQGYFLSSQAWRRVLGEVSPQQRLMPAYKNEESNYHRRESNIIDFLKFWVAIPEREKIFAEFHGRWPSNNNRREADPALEMPWMELKRSASPALKEVLLSLEKEVRSVREEWLKSMPKDLEFLDHAFDRLVESLCSQFRSIMPRGGDNELAARWRGDGSAQFSHWALIRASCLYHKYPASKMCWFLAGEELCRIKIGTTGPSREVLMDMLKIYRPDRKVLKRIFKEEELETEDVSGV